MPPSSSVGDDRVLAKTRMPSLSYNVLVELVVEGFAADEDITYKKGIYGGRAGVARVWGQRGNE